MNTSNLPESSIKSTAWKHLHAYPHTDFGNLITRVPAVIFQPTCIGEVQAVVSYAARVGRRIVCRGNGCSSFGQSLSNDLVLDTRGLTNIDLLGDHEVRAQVGCTIGQLQSFLSSRGLTCPVVISNEHATLGGVLSVGGFGPTSIRFGALAQHVQEGEIVTGTGELIRAEINGPHSRLLEYSLCGLGQVGILVSVVLRVKKYKPWTAIETRLFPAETDLSDLIYELSHETAWEHCRILFVNRIKQWKFELGKQYAEMPKSFETTHQLVQNYHREIFVREAHFTPSIISTQINSGLLKNPQQSRRIWSDFFIPAKEVNEFFSLIRSLFQNSQVVLGFNGTIVMQSISLMHHSLPLLPIPAVDLVQSFGIYSYLSSSMVPDYLERFTVASEFCHKLGGRQYLHGFYIPNVDFFQRQFGAEILNQWISVKQQYDPGQIFGTQLF